MLAKDVRAGKKSCLSKAADDEPVFILRAKDKLAPEVVEGWAKQLEFHYGPAASEQVKQKIAAARALAFQMRAWQAFNGSKLPD